MMKCYPDEKDEEQMRRSLGRYGLTGKQQVRGLAAGTYRKGNRLGGWLLGLLACYGKGNR